MEWSKASLEANTSASEKSSASESESGNGVVDSHVLFLTGAINKDSSLALQKALQKEVRQRRILQMDFNLDSPPPIWLRINSGGGGVMSSLALADAIERCPVPVWTLVEGETCSGATVVSMAGHRRFITPRSYMMIHQMSSKMWGTYQYLQEEVENCERLMKTIHQFYREHTGLNAKQVREMLKHDHFWPVEDCLEFGFVDEVYQGTGV